MRRVSWTRRSNAADGPSQHAADGMVSRLSQASGRPRASSIGSVQYGVSEEAGRPRVSEDLQDPEVDGLFDVSPLMSEHPQFDLSAVRAKLAAQKGKQYWRSL